MEPNQTTHHGNGHNADAAPQRLVTGFELVNAIRQRLAQLTGIADAGGSPDADQALVEEKRLSEDQLLAVCNGGRNEAFAAPGGEDGDNGGAEQDFNEEEQQ